MDSNATLPGIAQPPGVAPPYGAAAAETGDALAAMLAVTAPDGTVAVASTAGGSSAMNKKLAFQKVKLPHVKAIFPVRPVAYTVLVCTAQELDDFNNASKGRME